VGEVLAAAVFEPGAGGALAHYADAGLGEAGVQKLPAVGFYEIEMDLGADVGVAGGAGGEEKERVLFFDGVGVVDLGEEGVGVGELAFELEPDLFAYGEAAVANGWTDGGYEVFGAGAVFELHGSDAALDDAGQGAAPAGVEGGDGAGFGVSDEDGDAVCGLDAQENAVLVGHECVAAQNGFAVSGFERRVPCFDGADEAAVELADGDQLRGSAAGYGAEEAFAVFGYGGRVVFLCPAEVLFGFAVGGGAPTAAGAETGLQPGPAVPLGDADDAGGEAALGGVLGCGGGLRMLDPEAVFPTACAGGAGSVLKADASEDRIYCADGVGTF